MSTYLNIHEPRHDNLLCLSSPHLLSLPDDRSLDMTTPAAPTGRRITQAGPLRQPGGKGLPIVKWREPGPLGPNGAGPCHESDCKVRRFHDGMLRIM